MPIYAYRCSACGHAQDVLQKMSDPVLTTCPSCGAEAYAKQVTAAGFQLKGSGWYVTDFRNGNSAAPKADGAKPEAAKPAGDAAPAGDKPAAAAAAPAAAAPAAPPPPAPSP
jgi:putative FmdB family regulatory protein